MSATIAPVWRLPCGERLLAERIIDASRGCGGDTVGSEELVGGVAHFRAVVEPLGLPQSSVADPLPSPSEESLLSALKQNRIDDAKIGCNILRHKALSTLQQHPPATPHMPEVSIKRLVVKNWLGR